MCGKPGSTFVLSVLVWMLLSFSFSSFAEAQIATVGVKVGDWVKYGNISVTWDSEEMEPEQELVEMNETLWFLNEVLDVVDTVIVSRQTTQFKNNTEKSSAFHLDVHNGDGNDTLMYISSGLRANELLYPGSIDPTWINGTAPRILAGTIREANYLSLATTRLTEDDPPKFLQFSVSYYWDRETGVLASRSGTGLHTDERGRQIATWTMSDEIVETNLWSPDSNASNGEGDGSGNFPYAVVGIVAGSVVLVGVWSFWRRRKRFKRRKPRVRR
jgi:hypothetical protein